jgi:diguanylate cyclase (GGDEF)-like protein
VARLGGDEFAILLHDQTERKYVELVSERVIQRLTISVTCDQGDIPVSASMGIASYPEDGSESDSLIRHADQAMYHAKKNGKNQFRFFSDI